MWKSCARGSAYAPPAGLCRLRHSSTNVSTHGRAPARPTAARRDGVPQSSREFHKVAKTTTPRFSLGSDFEPAAVAASEAVDGRYVVFARRRLGEDHLQPIPQLVGQLLPLQLSRFRLGSASFSRPVWSFLRLRKVTDSLTRRRDSKRDVPALPDDLLFSTKKAKCSRASIPSAPQRPNKSSLELQRRELVQDRRICQPCW